MGSEMCIRDSISSQASLQSTAIALEEIQQFFGTKANRDLNRSDFKEERRIYNGFYVQATPLLDSGPYYGFYGLRNRRVRIRPSKASHIAQSLEHLFCTNSDARYAYSFIKKNVSSIN